MNLNDKRVRRRLEDAMDWCLYNLNEYKPKAWSTRYLDKKLGYTHKPLGRFCRETLLILADGHYNMNTGSCKSYLLNARGVKHICQLLDLPMPKRFTQFKKQRVLQHARNHYGTQIASGLFEYKEQSNRQWNPLQNVPSNLRTQLFSEYGYNYEYDIVSSAPTLIYQYAKVCGLSRPTPAIDEYLNDPNTWRDNLAKQVGCDQKQAKQIITARFAGARLGLGNSLYNYLDNRIQHWRLKNNEQFEQLTSDIKLCWDAVKKDTNTKKLSPRDKWKIYFELERGVMSVVQRELARANARFFVEHDGWRCDRFVVPQELRQLVKQKTGYSVDFKWTSR